MNTTTYSSLTPAQRTSAFVIGTQYMENYGDSEAPYWKAKGGYDYIVIGAPDADAAAKAVDAVLLNDSYNQEWVIATDTHAQWETTLPTDAEYRGFVIGSAKVIEYTP
jgi:hypothetical protein